MLSENKKMHFVANENIYFDNQLISYEKKT